MWTVDNPGGNRRVLVTRDLPGTEWRSILLEAGYRLDVWSADSAAQPDQIMDAIAPSCNAVIGQLTETWDEPQLRTLAGAGGSVYANYAVGFDNVDVSAATRLGLIVTNTPGVLTRTTAELAVALTLAAARRLAEADRFVRARRFTGWEPGLLLGTQLFGRTLGVVGAGRIGSAYARMMVRAFGMDLVYHGRSRNTELEDDLSASSPAVSTRCRFEPELGRLLKLSDVVSLHPSLNPSTVHLIDAAGLASMKPDAILVNVSRGPVIDETALVAHCREHPDFRVGLDVFEDEPALSPGLTDLPNVVLAPHIGSASTWTREAMSILSARNVVGVLEHYPLWDSSDFQPLLLHGAPAATPSIVNPEAAGWL